MRSNVLPEILFAFVAMFVVHRHSHGEPAPLEITKADVIIKNIDLKSRTIDVDHDGKISQLDVSRRVKVTIKGEPAQIDQLIPGDEATVEYHKQFAIVISINANGSVTQKWKFYDVFNRGIRPEQAFVVSEDGRLVCLGQEQEFCLATVTPLAKYKFQIEFMPSDVDLHRNYSEPISDHLPGKSPFVSVASVKPNPKSRDYYLQYPFGIEVYLSGPSAGMLMLPGTDFKAQRPLDQLRRDRKVNPIRRPEINPMAWNKLEITVDSTGSITFRMNGKVVNALAEAEATTGHIVIFPYASDIQFRSAALVLDGKEHPLPFTEILTK
jgi:hypothetical protein